MARRTHSTWGGAGLARGSREPGAGEPGAGERARHVGSGLALVLGVAAATLSGCSTIEPSFDSPEPGARNAAIVRTVATDDRTQVKSLVRMLESDDPTARVLAIRALERMKGTTLGYDPHGEEWERAAALGAWRAYADEQDGMGMQAEAR